MAMLLVLLFGSGTMLTATAQNKDEDFTKFESLIYNINSFYTDNPKASYDFNYDEKGEMVGVDVTGVADEKDRTQYQTWLTEYYTLSDALKYKKDNNGVYYRTEEAAEPEPSKHEFFTKLHTNLQYPDVAQDQGVEGVVQLKFIVDKFGNVSNLEVHEEIDGPDWVVDDMVAEAKKAFKNVDQRWEPGEVNNFDVSQWVMLPVHFSLELPEGSRLSLLY